MSRDYPHLHDTPFPRVDTVDAYSYANNEDYAVLSEKGNAKLLAVPWSADYLETVGFESDAERDAWFADAPGRSLALTDTMCRVPAETVAVPVPYGDAVVYNYIVIDKPTPPVDYATDGGITRYCYFIRSMDYRATNTTLLHLEVDWFQTFYNRCELANIMLERGHYPLAQTTVQEYLQNPLAHNTYLLTPDLTPVAAEQVGESVYYDLIGPDSWAIFAMTANVTMPLTNSAGEAQTPGSPKTVVDGVPSYNVFAIRPDGIPPLLDWMEATYPMLKTSIAGIFFVTGDLVIVGDGFALGPLTCYKVEGRENANIQLFDQLTTEDFDYPLEYINLAKLYTSPYARIEVTDGNGSVLRVNIEDTTGRLDVNLACSLAYPLAGINGYITDVGSATQNVLTYRQIDLKHRAYGGEWYRYLLSWDIPTYGVLLDSKVEINVAQQWSRDTTIVGYNAAYNSAVASANTAQANANNSSSNAVANTAIQTAANSTTVARSNQASVRVTNLGNSTTSAMNASDASFQRGVQEADANAVAATTLTNAVGGIVGGALSGGIGGLINGAIGAATAGVNAAIMLNATNEKVGLSVSNAANKVSLQNTNNSATTGANTSMTTDNINTSNTASTGMTTNDAATANTNAANSRATAVANAERSRNAAARGVDNTVRTAQLQAPKPYGSFAGDSKGPTSAPTLSAHIIKMGEGDIKTVGDAFLRYGYRLNQYIIPETLNVMQRFAYWQGDAQIIPVQGCPADAIMAFKDMFARGTTVYREPEYIGSPIYGNDPA